MNVEPSLEGRPASGLLRGEKRDGPVVSRSRQRPAQGIGREERLRERLTNGDPPPLILWGEERLR